MRVAVLVSGRGSNLQALLDAEARGELAPAEIALVLSNQPNAAALERARGAGKTTLVLDHRDFAGREEFDQAMLERLAEHRVDAVVLAGFMRILSSRFIDAFPRRIINTHPSLLPAFPGLHAARQAIAHGVKVTGCTIHFVDGGVDTGPIIAQACVPVLDSDSDDAAALHERIRAREHELLPRAVAELARGELWFQGRAVRSREARLEGASNHAD
jgi:phosphoribosylglycinamide formyltransferase-1